MSNTGLGGLLVFSGGISLDSLRWRNIGEHREYVDELDDTALDSTGYYENCPDDLLKCDAIPVEFFADLKKSIPVKTLGTITITFPKQPGQVTAATIVGSGYISEARTPPMAPGQRLIGNLQVRFDGKTGPAFTPAT